MMYYFTIWGSCRNCRHLRVSQKTNIIDLQKIYDIAPKRHRITVTNYRKMYNVQWTYCISHCT